MPVTEPRDEAPMNNLPANDETEDCAAGHGGSD
jgi:hypothetical protein